MPSSVRGRYRRHKALTMGPASGSYDIEWANDQNAVPGNPIPQVILAGDFVILTGRVSFTGTPSDGAFIFTLPEGVRPIYSVKVNDSWSYDPSQAGLQQNPGVRIDIDKDDGTVFIAHKNNENFANGDSFRFDLMYLRA